MPIDCDVDGDGSLAKSAACGGDDCDDADEDAHPGQSDYFTSPRVSGGYDYDCDGKSEPEFSGELDCSALLSACEGEGFSSPPACGGSGTWIRCESILLPILLCNPETVDTRQMPCH